MGKKELLLEIITKLLPYWDLGEGYLLLLQNTEDETLIDQLYTLFLTQIKTINSKQAQEALRATLQNLREREAKEKEQESEALELLLENLDF